MFSSALKSFIKQPSLPSIHSFWKTYKSHLIPIVHPSSPDSRDASSIAKKRDKSDFGDNRTAALALPQSTAALSANQRNLDWLLQVSEKFILEHAARRVDLFFYQLIAYYNKDAAVTRGRTDLQHGKGRNSLSGINVTQACHSSFIPSVEDKVMNRGRRNSILYGTHFLDSLNATVELPWFINELDNEFEERLSCRKNGMAILQKVSRGEVNPIEGLTLFLKDMNQLFLDIADKKIIIKTIKSDSVRQKVMELVKKGTLKNKFAADTKTVTNEYVQLLLRLTTQEKIQCKQSQKQRDKIYLEKIEVIQNEILTTKSKFRP
jgi:hypothetical protein